MSEDNEPPEELAILATSTNFMECPHCGKDLFILGQQKVYGSDAEHRCKTAPK